MKTLCEHCIFKKVENGVQTGCEFNKLDLFDKEFDGKFYTLNGICLTCRNCYWQHADADDKKEKLVAQSPLDYIILFDMTYKTTLSSVDKLVESIDKIAIQPKCVIFIKKVLDVSNPDIFKKKIVQKIMSLDKKYNLYLTDKSKDDRLFEAVRKHKEHGFYCLADPNISLVYLNNTIEQINSDLLFNQVAPTYLCSEDNKFKFISRNHFLKHGLEYAQSNDNNSES
jgi:hypothetical protein